MEKGRVKFRKIAVKIDLLTRRIYLFIRPFRNNKKLYFYNTSFKRRIIKKEKRYRRLKKMWLHVATHRRRKVNEAGLHLKPSKCFVKRNSSISGMRFLLKA